MGRVRGIGDPSSPLQKKRGEKGRGVIGKKKKGVAAQRHQRRGGEGVTEKKGGGSFLDREQLQR